MEQIQVFVVEGGQNREFNMAEYASKGDEGVYTLRESGNIYEFLVYSPTRNTKKTLQFSYLLKNGVEIFNDMATFNRKILGDNWQVSVKDFQATIKIPEGAAKEDLKIFAHGDLTGYTEILDNRTFNVQLAEADPYSSVEVQVIFPTKLVPQGKLIKNVDRLPEILKEEKIQSDKANQKREEAKKELARMREEMKAREARKALGNKASPFVLGGGLIAGIGAVMAAAKAIRGKKASFDGDYLRELPGDYSPAVMSYVMNRSNETRDLMATLLDLSRKEIIRLEPYVNEHRTLLGDRTEEDYRIITRSGEPGFEARLSDLLPHERHLYEWFMDGLAVNGVLELDDLSSMMKSERNARRFTSDYNRFKYLIADHQASVGAWTSSLLKSGFGILMGGIVLFLAGMAFLILTENPAGFAAILAGVIAFVGGIMVMVKPQRSSWGLEENAKWLAFRRFLLDFSNLDRAEIPALTIWNHYLVYATSLGVAKEVAEQLPKVFTAQELSDPTFTTYYHPTFYTGRGYTNMDRSLHSAMSNARSSIARSEAVAASRRSSSSGGGGGFSGGSSGGSGSDGGGGVF